MPAGNLTDEDLRHILILLGASAQDAALKAKIEADLPAPSGELKLALTVDKTGVQVLAAPGLVDFALCADKEGASPIYEPKGVKVGGIAKGKPGHEWVDAHVAGAAEWWSKQHGRIKVEVGVAPPPVEPPVEPPKPGAFKRGLCAGGWNRPQEVADLKRFPNPVVRLEHPTDTASFSNAGVAVIYLESAYNTGNVKAIKPATAVVNAQTTLRNHPDIWCYEYGNEPGGDWFFGPGAFSKENAAAYCKLLRAVRTEAMTGSKVLLLASFDGGHAGNNQWGHWMLEADPGIVSVVDAVSVHPYDGSGTSPSSTLVRWSAVDDAHKSTGKPVIISEYGRPLVNGTGDSPKSTEGQQAAADGAMVRKARESGFVLAVTIFGYRAGNYGVFSSSDQPLPAVAAIAAA